MTEERSHYDPAPAVSKPDAYDTEEGYLVDLEDIAIVVHEALRAYDEAIGLNHTGKPWMLTTKSKRDATVGAVRSVIANPDEPPALDSARGRLIVGITKALAQP